LGSDWGSAVTFQIVAALVLAAGIAVTLRSAKVGVLIGAIGALALTSSVAMSSHAASASGLRALAMASDSMHILTASVWLGTLLVFVVVGVPHLHRLEHPARTLAYRQLLRAFSSVALVSGGVLAM